MRDKSSLSNLNIWPSTPQPTSQSFKATSSPTSDLNDLGKLTSVDEPHPSSYHDNTLLDKTPEEDSAFIVPPFP